MVGTAWLTMRAGAADADTAGFDVAVTAGVDDTSVAGLPRHREAGVVSVPFIRNESASSTEFSPTVTP